MSNVVPIEANLPHHTGMAICVLCESHWVAVVPVGAQALECPTCGSNSRVWFFPDATAAQRMAGADIPSPGRIFSMSALAFAVAVGRISSSRACELLGIDIEAFRSASRSLVACAEGLDQAVREASDD